MDAAVIREIENLRKLTVGGLREKYLEVFGEESRSGNKDYLFRKIAWRLQAEAEGDLSERARRRVMEIANDTDSVSCAGLRATPGAVGTAALHTR